MTSSAVTAWPLSRISQALADGELSSAELVGAYTQRIATLDPMHHAIRRLDERAETVAITLDAERAAGKTRGPLHGLPVLLKDNIDTIDMPTTAGSLALAGTYASRDAPVVTRLRRAGAIILGKTNLSEWANFRSARSSSGWSSLGGQVRNATDLERTPGGSSSGSAVAAALGFCVGAVGTETDGSIVGPAAMNGIVGIKPSLGLINAAGIIPIAASQDTAGPMARRVNDACVLFAAMLEPGHATCDDVRKSLDASVASAHALRGARIGVARNYCGYHDGLDEVFERAIQRMAGAGATIIDPVTIASAEDMRPDERLLMAYEFKAGLNAYLETRDSRTQIRTLDELTAFNRAHTQAVMPYFPQDILETAAACGPLTDADYLAARSRCQAKARGSIDAAHKDHTLDAIVAPTASPAWRVDWVCGDNRKGGASAPAAIAGYPHVTVPMGRIQHLPVGLSLFSTALRDARLVQLAAAFEHTAPDLDAA